MFSGAAAELDAGTEIEMAPKGILCRELPVTTNLRRFDAMAGMSAHAGTCYFATLTAAGQLAVQAICHPTRAPCDCVACYLPLLPHMLDKIVRTLAGVPSGKVRNRVEPIR